jgi:hypothetical protein
LIAITPIIEVSVGILGTLSSPTALKDISGTFDPLQDDPLPPFDQIAPHYRARHFYTMCGMILLARQPTRTYFENDEKLPVERL